MADENVNSQAQASQEPQDIAQAFQKLRENQQAATQSAEQTQQAPQGEAEVGEQSSQQIQQGASSDYSGAGQEAGGFEPDVSPELSDGGGAGSIGGPTAYVQQNDYASLQNNLIASLQYEAQQNVINKFRQNDIQMMDVGDLYERREDGTVIFNNPDNPNHPFESREQAQAWINSMNQQIQNAFNQEVYKEQQELYRNATPSINLIQFAPYYDAMSPAVQSVFDDLIEPYGIANRAGDVIGFNCSLPAMAQQAMKIVEQYGIGKNQQAPVQQTQQPKSSGPAMDLKSGNGTSVDDVEPTNIEEAMALFNKRKKENNNGR